MSIGLARVTVLPSIGIALALALGILVTSPQSALTTGFVGFLAYGMIILINPFLGFLLWMSTFPFARFISLEIILGGSIPVLSLSRICLATLLLFVTAQIATGRRKPAPITSLDVAAVLSIIGIALSVDHAAQLFLDSYVLPVLAYWIAKNLIQTKSDLEKVVIAFLIVGAYSSVAAIQEQFTGSFIFDGAEGSREMYSKNVVRLIGLLGSPVAYGGILGMVLPFAFHYLLSAIRPLYRWLALLVVGLTTVALYATALRTAWIASLLGIAIMVLFHPTLRRPKARLITLASVALVCLLAIPFGDDLLGTMANSPIVAERALSDGPVRARLVLYSTTWRMALDNLVTGIGFENYAVHYTSYLTAWADIAASEGMNSSAPHNSFMYVLVSSGLLGFIPYTLVFFLMLFHVARACRRQESTNVKGLFVAFWVAMLSYWLNSMTADVVYLMWNSTYYFLLAGAFLAPGVSKTRE